MGTLAAELDALRDPQSRHAALCHYAEALGVQAGSVRWAGRMSSLRLNLDGTQPPCFADSGAHGAAPVFGLSLWVTWAWLGQRTLPSPEQHRAEFAPRPRASATRSEAVAAYGKALGIPQGASEFRASAQGTANVSATVERLTSLAALSTGPMPALGGGRTSPNLFQGRSELQPLARWDLMEAQVRGVWSTARGAQARPRAAAILSAAVNMLPASLGTTPATSELGDQHSELGAFTRAASPLSDFVSITARDALPPLPKQLPSLPASSAREIMAAQSIVAKPVSDELLAAMVALQETQLSKGPDTPPHEPPRPRPASGPPISLAAGGGTVPASYEDEFVHVNRPPELLHLPAPPVDDDDEDEDEDSEEEACIINCLCGPGLCGASIMITSAYALFLIDGGVLRIALLQDDDNDMGEQQESAAEHAGVTTPQPTNDEDEYVCWSSDNDDINS